MAGFDSTLGGSVANSYISLETADDIFQFNAQEAAWNAFDDDAKRAALVQATFYLEDISWAGTRCDPSTDDAALPQALAWPRSGASCDGVPATCGAIPKRIQQATAFLALNLATTPDAISGPIGGGGSTQPGLYVKRNKLGDLEQEFAEFTGGSDCNDCATPDLIVKFPWLKPLLACWAVIGSTNSKILLRVRS
nr:putative head-tail connector protein [uncultured Mediterranean phage uvMED]